MVIILGVVVSLLVQWLKQSVKTTFDTLLIVLGVSLAASGIYTALVATGYWETVGTVLMTAGAFYTFIIARFEPSNDEVSPGPEYTG